MKKITKPKFLLDKKLRVIYLLGVAVLAACASGSPTPQPKPKPAPTSKVEEKKIGPLDIIASRTLTDQTLYAPGNVVKLKGFSIQNFSREDAIIDSLWLAIGTASTNGISVSKKVKVMGYKEIKANAQLNIPANQISFSTAGFRPDSYLISLNAQLSSPDKGKALNQKFSAYLTFFRISTSAERLTYQIHTENFRGLPVYQLAGGLSAEYAVEKSIASINRSISHSWKDIDRPRESTPDFLQRSIDQTIRLYNQQLGATKKFKTVIISTGITPVSYLSRTMDAPVLPLHFLIGAHTVKEVQTILDDSKAHGLPAYATIGHDYSLSTSQSVAWIKLLDLPPAYQKFLKDHQVEQVVFFGATATASGEKAARLLKNGVSHQQPGSIYLMYFAGDRADGYYRQVLRDFDPQKLHPILRMADWESGIIQAQVKAMASKAKAHASVTQTVLITSSVDDIHLWNLATYAMLKFYQKNGITPKGVSLNPYLVGHPFYETYMGYVPFLYFDGVPAPYHISRIKGMLKKTFQRYFSTLNVKSLPFVATLSNRTNFSSDLKSDGYHVKDIGTVVHWNLNDGKNAPSEVRADEMLQKAKNATALKTWGNGLKYLTITDFKAIAQAFTGLSISEE